MRKLLITSLIVALTKASLAFAANPTVQADSLTYIMDTKSLLIPLSQLTKEMTEDFFTGKAPHLVLECSQGSILPLNLSLKGKCLALESGDPQPHIKILKTCFIKCVDHTLLFSADLHNWRDFQEFFTGLVGLSVNAEGGAAQLDFHIELNERS